MSKKQENGKVIELPVRRRPSVSGVQQPGKPPHSDPAPKIPDQRPRQSLNLEKKKIFVSLALVMVLVGVTIANRAILDEQPVQTDMAAFEAHPSRSIASVAPDSTQITRDAKWERQLASDLSRTGQRGPASIGRVASPEEQLQFGFLEGKYALQMKEGKVKNLRFVAVSEPPKFLKDRVAFLNRFRRVFPGQFDWVKLDQRKEKGRVIKETYSLYQGDEATGDRVSFELDLQERLLNLAVVD
jgi:hypothetical protein